MPRTEWEANAQGFTCAPRVAPRAITLPARRAGDRFILAACLLAPLLCLLSVRFALC
jgi:hypothetical protein